MNLTIPLYTEERRPKGSRSPRFTVRPLFFPEISWSHEQLSRATTKLAEALRRHFDRLATEPLQDVLAAWSFNPPLQEHHVRVDLELRRQTARFDLLVVSFESLDRKIALIPLLPDLCFEITRGQKAEGRVNEVLREHFLKLERDDDKFTIPESLTTFCNSWLSTLELDVDPKPRLEEPPSLERLFLGGSKTMNGREELQRVGRCLDWLFPDDLDRAVLRDTEVEELTRRLAETDKRPLLLLGPRSAGKTAILHESVYRRVDKLSSPHVASRNVWLLSPPRLISGMSYVGQWENRLLAILNEAMLRDHTLYFDDLLGLYHAGVSASSDLNVAQVLRPYAERRDLRLLAELTPEAFHILQEKDRAFADLFHVIPVKEMTEPQTRRVLVTGLRQHEARCDCVFALDVLPTVLDLQERYVRDLALPGKAAGFLRQLAVKHRNEGINRATVIRDFHDRSGLVLAYLDGEQKLERAAVLRGLGEKIIGQEAALAAMADTVCIARSRLNDPGRPLSTFLFLGPTGVGKTQAAKALAAYLFGHVDRLVRFDMNEYLDGYSVTRLVGTFREPDGLLTSAVRRQPFCVLLLDEIEKAHPAVFDLLLQVTGEGRLTDARGRTVDFTNAIIIMTSNLGVREAASTFGLRPGDVADNSAYLAAVERFFRPEFINRIDHIVPFSRLKREEIASIANGLITELFNREGLVHRQCVLQVEPEAMERIIDAGYHPQLGARALKRTIEKQITQPVAAKLAAMEPGAPAVLSVYPAGEGVAARMDALTYTPQQPCPAAKLAAERDAEWLLDAAETFMERVEREMESLQPAGHLRQGQISAGQFRYLALREHAQRIRNAISRLDRQIGARPEVRRAGPGMRPAVRPVRKKSLHLFDGTGSVLWKAMAAAESLENQLSEFTTADASAADHPLRDQINELLEDCALLGTMTGTDEGHAIVLLHYPPAAGEIPRSLGRRYTELSDRQTGASFSTIAAAIERRVLPPSWEAILADLPGAYTLLGGEQGTHLFVPARGAVAPVQVWVLPLPQDAEVLAALAEVLARRQRWRASAAPADEDPLRYLPVVRVYGENSATADLRTGLVATRLPAAHELRRFMIASLSLPEEFMEDAETE